MFAADGSTLKFWVLVPQCRCVLEYGVVLCSTE